MYMVLVGSWSLNVSKLCAETCWGRQLVPDTDGTRKEGVEMSIHSRIRCRPANSISHVVTSGGSCWYQDWCDGDGNQLINHSVLWPQVFSIACGLTCLWWSLYYGIGLLQIVQYVFGRFPACECVPSIRVPYCGTILQIWVHHRHIFAKWLWLAFSGHNHLPSYQFTISTFIEVPGLQAVSIGENRYPVPLPPPISSIG